MEIKKSVYKKVCDMGACRNIADYSIEFDNLSKASSIDICKECLVSLFKETKRVIYDKKDK